MNHIEKEKQAARHRMQETGESYQAALNAIRYDAFREGLISAQIDAMEDFISEGELDALRSMSGGPQPTREEYAEHTRHRLAVKRWRETRCRWDWSINLAEEIRPNMMWVVLPVVRILANHKGVDVEMCGPDVFVRGMDIEEIQRIVESSGIGHFRIRQEGEWVKVPVD